MRCPLLCLRVLDVYPCSFKTRDVLVGLRGTTTSLRMLIEPRFGVELPPGPLPATPLAPILL